MGDKSGDSEVTSSVMSGNEEPESTTPSGDGENGNGTPNLDFTHDDEPPKKSPKTKAEIEAEEESIEMTPAVVSSGTPETETPNVQSSTDPEGNHPPELSRTSVTEKESPTSDGDEPMSISEPEPEVLVDLRVVYNKQPMPVQISLKKTVGDLKRLIEKSTNVTPELMKVLVKGAKDELTLESIGITKGSKVLIIGTPLDQVMAVAKAPTAKELSGDDSNASPAESLNWCVVPRHQKVLDKGLPDDVMAGIRDEQEPLPPFPLFGMLSSKGAKVRLTFKLECDELWIGTKERTEKVPISTIRSVTSQPIIGYEHYHILAIQMGPTEASRFFLYWVPNQYVTAIKRALGS